MTKRIAMALALVTGVTSAASGQAVTVRAQVPQIVEATGAARDLVFPAYVAGSQAGLSVDETMTGDDENGQLGYQAYRLNYSGPSVSVPATLVLTSGTVATTITADITCGEGAVNAVSVTLASCAAGQALTHAGQGVRTRRLFVGGSIAQSEIDAADPAADYTGTLTLTLTP